MVTHFNNVYSFKTVGVWHQMADT